jgi:hypothetical protein
MKGDAAGLSWIKIQAAATLGKHVGFSLPGRFKAVTL